METNEEIYNKWKITGLLSGLSDKKNSDGVSQAMECALFLEETTNKLIQIGAPLFGDGKRKLVNVALPVARRIFGKLGHRKSFFSELEKFFSANPYKKEEDIVNEFVEQYIK